MSSHIEFIENVISIPILNIITFFAILSAASVTELNSILPADKIRVGKAAAARPSLCYL